MPQSTVKLSLYPLYFGKLGYDITIYVYPTEAVGGNEVTQEYDEHTMASSRNLVDSGGRKDVHRQLVHHPSSRSSAGRKPNGHGCSSFGMSSETARPGPRVTIPGSAMSDLG